jgi:dihydropteroate synthase
MTAAPTHPEQNDRNAGHAGAPRAQPKAGSASGPAVPHWLTGLGPLPLEPPLYLGIVNITPDSMSDGGRYLEPDAALARGRELAARGAGVLDLGAESTRPGAAELTPEQEWARLAPVLERLRAAQPGLPLSVDTRHAAVAERALAAGAAILNDVTGFSDPAMLAVARSGPWGLVAMRSRLAEGRLLMPDYTGPERPDGLAGTVRELAEVRDRLLAAGIAPERILLDPGFGFGTSFLDDRALWDALADLPRLLDWPVHRFCVAVSRKRFLAWRAGRRDLPPWERDELTSRAHGEALALGYRVFRSHEIAEG